MPTRPLCQPVPPCRLRSRMALATQLEPGEELSREDAPVSSGFRCACTSGHVAPVLLSITAKEGADQMKKNAAQGGTRGGLGLGGARVTLSQLAAWPDLVRLLCVKGCADRRRGEEGGVWWLVAMEVATELRQRAGGQKAAAAAALRRRCGDCDGARGGHHVGAKSPKAEATSRRTGWSRTAIEGRHARR